MSIENITALPFVETGVEALFRVAPVTGDGTHGRSEMPTGP
ncbi:hypothetical protein [Rhodococcus opacus]|nr:hypothetical protein [Rhodococcus opacus]ELB91059.1 hypothetical protein Rwratislav_21141 [Rhodococcus wratislaviensis IFP 2016]MDJ0415820.1 hypothetical protein [Rhodococcus opacus]MDX5967341.1 hypothetical protein [Rhodococcus opacus]CAG7585648.1 hypothetical protein E143388_02107 [Rhodococcus opacus]